MQMCKHQHKLNMLSAHLIVKVKTWQLLSGLYILYRLLDYLLFWSRNVIIVALWKSFLVKTSPQCFTTTTVTTLCMLLPRPRILQTSLCSH